MYNKNNKLLTKSRHVSLSHWGAFKAEVEAGQLVSAYPLCGSGADAEMIGAIPELVYSSKRVNQPFVREGWLKNRGNFNGVNRGYDRMVPISWQEVLLLVSDELARVRDIYGYKSIFAGSYGWSSAGRFHHARTQTRRFFGAFGGFTDQYSNYSWGAAQVLLQHILGTADAVSGGATSWSSIAESTDVFVAFGGLAEKNWRVTSGGAGNHHMTRHIREAARRGTKFVIVSPVADDIPSGLLADWIAPRPGSDTAILLGLCHEMIKRGRADKRFLAKYCTGSEEFQNYLMGVGDGIVKSLSWASKISNVSLQSLKILSDKISTGRVMLTASWSLQRAHRGEQPYWALIALASILGQVGLPGGGFSFGYGSLNAVGEGAYKGLVPSLSTLGNPGGTAIPVARFADMLERPNETVDFNGAKITYPDVKLIYWAGGNPFHHAQDLFRLSKLWAKPETVIVHEQFWTTTAERADIVLPATTSFERNDIGGTSRDPHVFFMPKIIEPVASARNDFDIYSDLASMLGFQDAFTEKRSEMDWLSYLWKKSENQAHLLGIQAPNFRQLVEQNFWRIPKPPEPEILLGDFIRDPEANSLPTPSGKIELNSETIGSYSYADLKSHPYWQTPKEWIGSAREDEIALLSRQPQKFLHSQLNQTSLAKRYPPTVVINSAEAKKRRLMDNQVVTLRSRAGACLATLKISENCRDGVAIMETGHKFIGGESGIDMGGNANALTSDFPTSSLSQASAAQSCLITILPAENSNP